MTVRVVKTGHHDRSASSDDSASGQAEHLLVQADDLAVPDADGRRRWLARIDGPDSRIAYQQVKHMIKSATPVRFPGPSGPGGGQFAAVSQQSHTLSGVLLAVIVGQPGEPQQRTADARALV